MGLPCYSLRIYAPIDVRVTYIIFMRPFPYPSRPTDTMHQILSSFHLSPLILLTSTNIVMRKAMGSQQIFIIQLYLLPLTC